MYLPSASAVAASLIALTRVRASNAAQIRDNEVQHANMMPAMGRNFRRLLAGSSNIERITIPREKNVRIRRAKVEVDRW